MNATTILCILLLSLSIVMTLFLLVRSIIDAVEEHKRDKRNAEWDAEHKKLCEKRDAEYHAARMKELENK